MKQATRRTFQRRCASAAAVCLACASSGAAFAAEEAPSGASAAGEREPDLSQTLAATTALKPMNLLLTQAELRSVIRNYELRTGESFTDPIVDEEVIVTAPGVRAPMRDPSQDIGQGLFAPFWAIANPRDAWRIFVPIPPKGPLEDERPAPDPR
jgi:hypothetical protein